MPGKIQHALKLIQQEAGPHAIVASSFGKDSMVMLALVAEAGVRLPILFFREPFFPEKYAFANAVIRAMNFTVYDYPPLATGLVKEKGQFEVLNFHQVGTPEEYLTIPTGIVPPENGKPFLCGRYDLLNKPRGTYEFPWTTLFIGHKSSDVDPLYGSVPLVTDIVQSGPLKLVFPLRAFTDADIWEYHEEHDLPVHNSRYNQNAGWKEFEDKGTNPDYFPACMACLDRDEAAEVFCPKQGRHIPNISSSISYQPAFLPGYIGDK